MTASHTHSGVGALERNFVVGLIFGPYNEDLAVETADKITKAVLEAQSKLQPCSMFAAQTALEGVTRNRRDPSYNYDTRRFGPGYDASASKNVTDPTLSVLRLDDRTGSTVALLFHFATHATTLGADNMLLSADWPGVAQRIIEENFPGAVVLYMNGAEGDQAPDMGETQDDFESMETVGARVAEGVLDVAVKARPIASTPVRSVMVRRRIPVKIRFSGIPVPDPIQESTYPPMPLMAVRVGEVAFMACPLELICEIGLIMKQGAKGQGFKMPLVAGLANASYAYCVTPDEYDRGGYEADATMYGKIEAGLVIGEQMMLVRKLLRPRDGKPRSGEEEDDVQ